MELEIKLDEVLRQNGITQKELSRKTGLHPSTISDMCRNSRTCVNKKQLGQIAEVLHIKDVNKLLIFQ